MMKITGRNKLMDWAKTITVDELIKQFFCPSQVGLEEINCDGIPIRINVECKQCWQQALEKEYEI